MGRFGSLQNHANTFDKAQHTLTAIKCAASVQISCVHVPEPGSVLERYTGIAFDIVRKLPDQVDAHFVRFIPCIGKLMADVSSLVDSLSVGGDS